MSQRVGADEIREALADPDLAEGRTSGRLLLFAGPPARLVWAGEAAVRWFGGTFESIAERLALGEDPGAKRFRQLAYAQREQGPARQEVLRFRCGASLAASTWTVWRLRTAPWALAARLEEGATIAPSFPDRTAQSAAVEQAPADAVAESLRRRWRESFPGAHSLRFRWRADAQDRITELEGPFCAALGWKESDLIGRDLSVLAEAHGLDPEGRVAQARAARETWSRLRVDWPIAGEEACAPITLGASPAFGRDGRFEGWIGFGVIDLDGAHRVARREAAVDETARTGSGVSSDEGASVEPGGPESEQEQPELASDEEERPRLTDGEELAFQEIARALLRTAGEPRDPELWDKAAERGSSDQSPADDAQAAPESEGASPPFEEQTVRIRALEAELRRRDCEGRELHAILDTATDGVAVLDAEGRLVSLNRAGQALFGRDQSEAAGEAFVSLLAPESHASALDYFTLVASNGVASLLNDGRELLGRARRGGVFPIFLTLGRLPSFGEARFCAVMRDMTAWKKAEAELKEARREAERASALKSDFLAKVSHEIRTPLNAILGFAEVIMDERFGPVGNDRYREYLKDIHASGVHVMSLVNDLLDLSKIEAGKMELAFGEVDVNRVVGDCVSIMQPQANSERVIVRLSTAQRLPQVVADERSLRQIVLNLLSNAVKFNEPGGQAIVSTALTDAGHVVIRIRDTGVGMSETELVTALEPFRQVQTSRQTSGTGLGLPLTKALVEANHASFTVKSRKAEGTLVEVAFPPARVLTE